MSRGVTGYPHNDPAPFKIGERQIGKVDTRARIPTLHGVSMKGGSILIDGSPLLFHLFSSSSFFTSSFSHQQQQQHSGKNRNLLEISVGSST